MVCQKLGQNGVSGWGSLEDRNQPCSETYPYRKSCINVGLPTGNQTWLAGPFPI